MELEGIRALHAIVEEGSFRAAAAKLNRVQSAISYQIKNLEESLGLSLFDREQYRPKLTASGLSIYKKSKSLMFEIEELEDLAGQLAMGIEAQLSLDISPLASMREVGLVLQEFSRAFPHTQLQIAMTNFLGPKKVEEGSVSLAITTEFDAKTALEYTYFDDLTLIPVASALHPLCQREKKPTRSEVLKYSQILTSSGDKETEHIRHGVIDGIPTWSVRDFSAKKELLLAGLGWGNMPYHEIEQELRSGVLKQIQAEFLDVVTLKLYVVRSRFKPQGPASEHLWHLFDQCRGN